MSIFDSTSGLNPVPWLLEKTLRALQDTDPTRRPREDTEQRLAAERLQEVERQAGTKVLDHRR